MQVTFTHGKWHPFPQEFPVGEDAYVIVTRITDEGPIVHEALYSLKKWWTCDRDSVDKGLGYVELADVVAWTEFPLPFEVYPEIISN